MIFPVCRTNVKFYYIIYIYLHYDWNVNLLYLYIWIHILLIIWNQTMTTPIKYMIMQYKELKEN